MQRALNKRLRWVQGWPLPAQYALAIGAVLVALLVRIPLDPVLGDRVPFITLFTVMLPLVLLVRAGPFLIASLVGLVGIVVEFHGHFLEGGTAVAIELALFALAALAATMTAWIAQRQQKLQHSADAMLRAFVDDAPACKWITNEQGQIVYANQAMATALGKPVDQVIGRTHAELLPPRLAQFAVEHIRAVRASGEPRASFEEIEPLDGSGPRRVLEWRRFVLKVEQDGHVLVAGMANDVTERTRIERELREREDALRGSEARHRALFEVAVHGVLTIDEHGIIESANPAAERLFGYAASEMIGRNVSMLMPEPYRSEHDSYLGNYSRTGVPKIIGIGREIMGQRKDGTTFPADLAVSEGRLGERRFFTGMISDISERKQAERERADLLEAERAARTEAEQAGRIKDEFLATVSHELRSPLNAILGWAQLLKRTHTDETTLSAGIEAILNSGRMQAQLIDDLLDMNRIMSGKLRLDVQSVELARVVEEALASVRPSADAKGIRVEALLDPAAGPVRGDPVRLQQVAWNLLGNAIKFTGKGGRVQVVLERTNSHVELTVADTGVGMKPEFLPHVFDRFRQADSSSTRAHGGLGLGLAIAKQITELHGGTISAISEGEGKGATFRVRLPVSIARSTPQAIPPTESIRSNVQLTGVQILIVDDDTGACDVLERMLTTSEAQVNCVYSGEAAIERIKAGIPDILLCDIGMPGMDGLTLMRRLRAEGLTLPAIAITAFARTEDRIRAMQAGFNMHLSKPIDAQELITAIETLLKTVSH